MIEQKKTFTPVWQSQSKTAERITFPQSEVTVKHLEKDDLIGLLNSGPRQAEIVLSLVNSGLTDAYINKAVRRDVAASVPKKDDETVEAYRVRTAKAAQAAWDTLLPTYTLDLSSELERAVLEEQEAAQTSPPVPRATKKIVLSNYDQVRSYFDRWDALNGVETNKLLSLVPLDGINTNSTQAEATEAFEKRYTPALALDIAL